MAVKNTMLDLHNTLFEELERLNDADLKDEDLSKEMKRAKAMSGIAGNIIKNAELSYDATKLSLEYGMDKKNLALPPMLQGNGNGNK